MRKSERVVKKGFGGEPDKWLECGMVDVGEDEREDVYFS